MRLLFSVTMATAAFVLCVASPVRAGITGTTLVANAGQAILGGVADPTNPNRLFIAGREGSILSLDLAAGEVDDTPFLTIPGVSTLNSEGGLLGLALHPDYAENGLGYAYYTTNGGAFNRGVSRVASFQRDPANPDRGIARSITPVLSFDQPMGNHNAGWIGFSPVDGNLYIASGDGGGGNDFGSGHTPGTGNAQDITDNLLGKILRVDVDGDDFPDDPARNYAVPEDNPFVDATGDDEIWSYGLRNPFRNSFDRETGDLWIGDVGQGVREEINFQPANSPGGENYGWRLREGTIPTPARGIGGPRPPGAVDPVYDYAHGFGAFQGNSVTGGQVYRGPDATLDGLYFFTDFVSDNFWTFDPADPAGTVDNINPELFGSGPRARGAVSFTEDLEGNLYILTINGDIRRIETAGPGDFNGDGFVDAADYTVWRDGLGDRFDIDDYRAWRDNFGASAAPAGALVPEPSALLLLAASATAAAYPRRIAFSSRS